MKQTINYRIDNLQYCNWSREIFQINNEARLDAVHVTIAYHEDFDEVKKNVEIWNKHFQEYKNLIIHGKTFQDIERAHQEKKTAIFFGFQNCSPIEDDIGLVESVHKMGEDLCNLLITINHYWRQVVTKKLIAESQEWVKKLSKK